MSPAAVLALLLCAGILAGLLARRLPASGVAALMIALVPLAAGYYAFAAC